MSEQALLDRIQELEPFAAESDARQALVATLMVLGSMLPRDDLAALDDELPAELGRLLRTSLPHPLRDWYTFSRRVADAEGVRLGIAIEHSEAVCHALSEELPREARLRFQRSLPTLATLFELPERDKPVMVSSPNIS